MSDTPEVALPPVSDEQTVQDVSDMCNWHPDQVRRTLIASAYAERAAIVAWARGQCVHGEPCNEFHCWPCAMANKVERGEHHA